MGPNCLYIFVKIVIKTTVFPSKSRIWIDKSSAPAPVQKARLRLRNILNLCNAGEFFLTDFDNNYPMDTVYGNNFVSNSYYLKRKNILFFKNSHGVKASVSPDVGVHSLLAPERGGIHRGGRLHHHQALRVREQQLHHHHTQAHTRPHQVHHSS